MFDESTNEQISYSFDDGLFKLFLSCVSNENYDPVKNIDCKWWSNKKGKNEIDEITENIFNNKLQYTQAPTDNDDVVNFAALPKGPTPNPLSSDYDPKRKPFKYFRKNIKEYCGSVNDPGYSEMGVGGTLGGASNKEGMDTYKDPLRNIKNDYGIKIKKKKNSEKK